MADSSFDVVLADDFSQGYRSDLWGSPFNGGTYWNGAFSWSGADVNVRGGVMEVTNTRHADGSWTAGGFNSFKAGHSITYGRIEFDGRVEEAQGTMGVFLTWPASDTGWPGTGEIDILETPALDVMHTSHWAGADGSHQYGSIRNQSYDETQWNHYSVLWLPDLLTVSVNGSEVARWTDPAAIPDVAHGIGAMGFVGSPNDGWIGGAPDSSTPSTVRVQMDNVVMSQWNGGPVDPIPAPVGPGPAAPREPAVLEAGSGPDVLLLRVRQDAWQGDVHYAVKVDGAQVGGTFTASAVRGEGDADALMVRGAWSPGEHKVEVVFLNDAFDANADWSRPELVTADRNLHVESASFNGVAVEGAALGVYNEWSANSFTFTEATPDPAPVDPGPVEPDPVDPGPVLPGPVAPGPVSPGRGHADIEGGDGADTISVRLEGISVSGGGGADLLLLRATHADVSVVMNEGEGEGDEILGFVGAGREGGDVLDFHGFGADGKVWNLGHGDFGVSTADGSKLDVFTMPGVDALAAGDYVFHA